MAVLNLRRAKPPVKAAWEITADKEGDVWIEFSRSDDEDFLVVMSQDQFIAFADLVRTTKGDL